MKLLWNADCRCEEENRGNRSLAGLNTNAAVRHDAISSYLREVPLPVEEELC